MLVSSGRSACNRPGHTQLSLLFTLIDMKGDIHAVDPPRSHSIRRLRRTCPSFSSLSCSVADPSVPGTQG